MVSVTVKFAGYLLHIVYPVFDMITGTLVGVTVKFAGYLLHIVYPVFDTVMVGVAVCREGVWTPPVRAWRHCAWYWGSRTSPRSSQAPSLPTREYS